MKTKSEIRKEIKNLLKENHSSLLKENQAIINRILSSEEYKWAEYLLAYMALPDEVDLSQIIKAAIMDNKIVGVPKVSVENLTMEFYKYNGQEKTEAGYCNINEPVTNDILEVSELKGKKVLMLVPGRAFSKKGERIGRGKGFYDKYLEKLMHVVNRNQLCLMGVCFECQLKEKIPVDSHDILMDRII